ncbi:hypothetical protein WN944_025327 [Citrus x changshan-huyou]|uniref:Uncharacterized protein n=1 Tax=Citrus x changshan-huyou TaxID=2935761 RepID=A0AAP0LPL3_9ROSI
MLGDSARISGGSLTNVGAAAARVEKQVADDESRVRVITSTGIHALKNRMSMDYEPIGGLWKF